MRNSAMAAALVALSGGAFAAGHGAPVVAPGSSGEVGVPNVGDARVEVYGQAMIDGIYDFNRMNPDWAATLRPSQIPITCPGDPGCGENGQFLFSIRQSSLGVRAFIPTSMGMVRTDLAFDLFGTDGGTNIHWLRAWAELDMYGAGQNDSNFMDISVFPNTIDYWGPSGMVFVRNPQLRITPLRTDNQTLAVSLEAPNSAIDTGKVSEIDPSFGAAIQPKNKWPDLVVSYRYGGDWGHVRGAGILRSVGYHNTASADGEPSKQLTGYGVNATGTVKLFGGKDSFNWGAVAGKAIASYMNDGGIDIAPDATLRGQAVTSYGYLLYYNHAWNDKMTSAVGVSEHKQNTTDGQLASAFRRGSYASVNFLYQLTNNVMTGGEFIWGRKSDKGGASANDSRLQWSTRVAF